ncbi:troponin T, skeletal muscle isoform X3 [Maniola jurtina]|uniref:troponin T, skeletal muscle isoform X3 n=1 Tax=Maniola jurtina TaxID=191418 RepID=UPI001E686837|nr:troponin T, skeletal muscle isoform X3 [Maniola jurtina]
MQRLCQIDLAIFEPLPTSQQIAPWEYLMTNKSSTCLTKRNILAPRRRKSKKKSWKRKPIPRQESRPSIPGEGDPEFIKRQDQKRSDLDEQLKEYINEWRKQRAKEEDELKRLKEKQAKRKVSRAEEEKRLAQKKKEEEERRIREIEEKKQRDIEEKRQRLEEAEKKRQAMLQAMKESSKTGPNFTIQKKSDNFGLSSAQLERNKTKEQLEEEKKISLSIRIKPLAIEGLSVDKLRQKATELWECIIKLETEKYDLEERQKRQDYDLKELKERQKQQLRHKALKKGLDPEALTGKHPPKIQVASKYERRVDTRSYDDKKKLFEGDLEKLNKDFLEKVWQERAEQFGSRQTGKAKRRKIVHSCPGWNAIAGRVILEERDEAECSQNDFKLNEIVNCYFGRDLYSAFPLFVFEFVLFLSF